MGVRNYALVRLYNRLFSVQNQAGTAPVTKGYPRGVIGQVCDQEPENDAGEEILLLMGDNKGSGWMGACELFT
jgi:hypothetical protein